jgi:hypothetical protein
VSRADFVEVADGFRIKVEGWTVGCLVIDSHFRLHLFDRGKADSSERHFQVAIEQPFTFRAEGEVEASLVADRSSVQLGRCLDLMWQLVTELHVSNTSELAVRFANGAEIRVSSIPRYESWQLSGYDNLPVVSRSDGEEPSIWWGGSDTPQIQLSPDGQS